MHGRVNKEQMQEQVQASKGRQQIFLEKCLNKWAKADGIGGKDLIQEASKNLKKAKRIAHALQMQESAMAGKLFVEGTTISTSFAPGLRPENVLKAVYIGVANSKRGDIVHEMPLQTTDDALIYMNAVYTDSLRDATANSKIYESTSKYYAGETCEASLGTGNGGTFTFSAAVTPNPIIPYNTRILVGGAIVGVDNGAGVLTGTGVASGTVTYSSGLISVTLTSAPATGVVVMAVYNWNSESSGNYAQMGTVTMDITKTRWNARPMPLGYKYSDMTQIMFDTTGMGDYKGMIERAVGDTHAKQKDFRCIARLKEVALSNPVETFSTDHASEGWVDGKAYAQFLTKKIGEVNARVFNEIQRGQFNKIVGGPKAVNYLRLIDGWQEVTSDFISGVFQAGKLSGIDVFQCPAITGLVDDNELILCYTNPDEALDLGLVYGTLIEQVVAELRYPQFYTEGQICAVEDSKLINGKFIRRLVLTGL